MARTYSSQGKTARFRLEFGEPTAMEDRVSKHFDVKTGKGRFVAEPGSDASVLLLDLKKALLAQTVPKKTERVPTLPFTS